MRSATACDAALREVTCMPWPSWFIAFGADAVLAFPLVVPKPATSAAATARIASIAIVCVLCLIKEPPPVDCRRPFARTRRPVRQYDQHVLPTRDDVELARV